MLENMTGSSILESTDHTNQVKPGNLSDKLILIDGEPYSNDICKSESQNPEDDSDDDWESCGSLVSCPDPIFGFLAKLSFHLVKL